MLLGGQVLSPHRIYLRGISFQGNPMKARKKNGRLGRGLQAFKTTLSRNGFVQQFAAQIHWFHNCVLRDDLGEPTQRLWYVRKVKEQGWSRNTLAVQIKVQARKRQVNVGIETGMYVGRSR